MVLTVELSRIFLAETTLALSPVDQFFLSQTSQHDIADACTGSRIQDKTVKRVSIRDAMKNLDTNPGSH